jgi:hypothetical protein
MLAALMGGCVSCNGEAEHAATHREYRYQLPPAHRSEANDLRLGQRSRMPLDARSCMTARSL